MVKRAEKHLAVIPARAGSKGLAGKNMRSLCGFPLASYTIETALDVGFFDRIVVTTDMPELIDYCGTYIDPRLSVIKRPNRLCKDTVPMTPVVIHALQQAEAETMENYTDIWTLQATSPLRTEEDILKAYTVYKQEGATSLASVTEELHTILKGPATHTDIIRRPADTRQTTQPWYICNGAIFITKKSILTNYEDRLGISPSVYVMDQASSLDIHNEEDLKLAEFYMRKRLLDADINNR